MKQTTMRAPTSGPNQKICKRAETNKSKKQGDKKKRQRENRRMSKEGMKAEQVKIAEGGEVSPNGGKMRTTNDSSRK